MFMIAGIILKLFGVCEMSIMRSAERSRYTGSKIKMKKIKIKEQ